MNKNGIILKRRLKKILGENLLKSVNSLRQQYFGKSEQVIMKQREVFYSSFIKPGELCFDVGANVGNRIEPLLNIGAKVLAVEPQKSCHDQLHKKFGNRIILITKGLADVEGIKKFYISNDSVNSSFSEEFIKAVKVERFKDHSWDEIEEIEMTTLDNLVAQYGVPAFIKIDVEGYELEVLKGLHTPVKMISFEYATPEQTARAIDCIHCLHQLNNGNIECNYSIGESMVFALRKWLPMNKMEEHILSKTFIYSAFGDIYVRQTNGV